MIDKGKYFNLILDDVYEVQADINMMNLWSDDAAQQFKIVIDREVLISLIGKAAPTNRGTPPARSRPPSISASPARRCRWWRAIPAAGKIEIIDLLVRLGQVLDEQNIPETGRWVVIPAWLSAHDQDVGAS